MLGKLYSWDETIVALSTAPGIGALAVIRLSGPSAIDIVNALFPSKDLSVQPTHTLHIGILKNGNELLDEVVLSIFRAPKSYTGEDVVEISCHGSPHIEEKILSACTERGARMARAGEFTQRAFLKGKMDLVQAEAVADLIASHSEAARLSALHTMRGGFTHDLKMLREQLLGFSALIELELDFSQEDVEFADRKKFYALIEEAQEKTAALIESFTYGNVIRNGVQVAIVGKPNAGKSTLLNSLLNEQRAIVSEIAGTTRDTVEELLVIEGIEFRLIDTAGIRAHTADQIEQMGMDKTREKIAQADIVLEIVDGSDLSSGGISSGGSSSASDAFPSSSGLFSSSGKNVDLQAEKEKLIRVLNKTDLIPETVVQLDAVLGQEAKLGTETSFLYDGNRRTKEDLLSRFPEPAWIHISAKKSMGIDKLKHALVERVLQGKKLREGTVVTNARHVDALKQVAIALQEIRTGLDNNVPGDLLSPDIRRCLHFLGEITGEITTEEQLSWIFGKFCIGK
jgi:tRNA modification GTPase